MRLGSCTPRPLICSESFILFVVYSCSLRFCLVPFLGRYVQIDRFFCFEEPTRKTIKLVRMKNKTALVSIFMATSSFSIAEIVINNFLSVEGFVDMAYTHSDVEVDNNSSSNNRFGLDQVEIHWLFRFDSVSATVEFAYFGSDADGSIVDSGDDTQVEQAYLDYAFGNNSTLSVGRFESMLGFEGTEPTDLYQKSSAYELPILPAYSEGVRYSYEYGDFFLGASLLSSYDNAIGRLGGSNRVLSDAPGIDSDYAVELAGSCRVDNVFLFLGGYYTDVEAVRFDDDGSIYAINVYLTYERGAWLFAGELNAGNNKQGATDTDLLSSLLMMNYSYNDAASITGRISYESSESNALESRDTKLTFAHNYSFTDNLRLVTEVSVVEGKTDAAGVERDNESLFGAVELIFAF